MEEARAAELKALSELEIEEIHKLTPAVEHLVQQRTDQLLAQQHAGRMGKPKREGLFYVPAAETGRGMPASLCSVCGERKFNMSTKVLWRWTQKHNQKTGHPILKREDMVDEESSSD